MIVAGPQITPKNILPSTVFQLDGKISACYSGSGQNVYNVYEHPSDGSTKATYDFVLGTDATVTTSDPTWATDKWTVDGGDYLSILSNTTYLNNTFQSGSTTSWWIVEVFKIGAVGATQLLSGTSNATSMSGWRNSISTTGTLSFQRTDGTAATSTNLHTGLVAGTDYIHVFCFNNSTREYKTALNSRTFTTGTASTVTPAGANTGRMCFGSANRGTSAMSNGSELLGISMGVGMLTDEDLKNIINYYNALRNHTYA